MFSLFGATLCSCCGMLICYFLNYNPVLGIILGAPVGFLTIDLFIRGQRRVFYSNIYYYLNKTDDYHGLTEALFGLLGALTHGRVYHGYHKGRNLYKSVLNLSSEGRQRADRFYRLGAAYKLSVPDILSFLFTVSRFSAHLPLLTYEMCLQMLLRKGTLTDAELNELKEISAFFGLSDKKCRRLINKRRAQISAELSATDKLIDDNYFASAANERANKNTAGNGTTRDDQTDLDNIPHEVLAAFSLLQLRYDAALDEVTAAYKKLRFNLHPDRHPQADDREKARLTAELIRLQAAYATLSAYLTQGQD